MSTFYDAYGEYAQVCSDPLILGGRNKFQQAELESAIDDVRRKLHPCRDDRFLDIGCNIGIFLSNLAKDFREGVGQDHEALLRVFERRGVPANVNLFAGFWPDVQAEGKFDCILAYSVISILPDAPTAHRFIDACLQKMEPGARLLIGDLPNVDARARFLASDEGREIAKTYDERRRQDRQQDCSGEYTKRDEVHVRVAAPVEFINDEFVISILREARRRGFEAYIVPQSDGLSFCRSREDILIVRRR